MPVASRIRFVRPASSAAAGCAAWSPSEIHSRARPASSASAASLSRDSAPPSARSDQRRAMRALLWLDAEVLRDALPGGAGGEDALLHRLRGPGLAGGKAESLDARDHL